jgi:hypothetical protein
MNIYLYPTHSASAKGYQRVSSEWVVSNKTHEKKTDRFRPGQASELDNLDLSSLL